MGVDYNPTTQHPPADYDLLSAYMAVNKPVRTSAEGRRRRCDRSFDLAAINTTSSASVGRKRRWSSSASEGGRRRLSDRSFEAAVEEGNNY